MSKEQPAPTSFLKWSVILLLTLASCKPPRGAEFQRPNENEQGAAYECVFHHIIIDFPSDFTFSPTMTDSGEPLYIAIGKGTLKCKITFGDTLALSGTRRRDESAMLEKLRSRSGPPNLRIAQPTWTMFSHTRFFGYQNTNPPSNANLEGFAAVGSSAMYVHAEFSTSSSNEGASEIAGILSSLRPAPKTLPDTLWQLEFHGIEISFPISMRGSVQALQKNKRKEWVQFVVSQRCKLDVIEGTPLDYDRSADQRTSEVKALAEKFRKDRGVSGQPVFFALKSDSSNIAGFRIHTSPKIVVLGGYVYLKDKRLPFEVFFMDGDWDREAHSQVISILTSIKEA